MSPSAPRRRRWLVAAVVVANVAGSLFPFRLDPPRYVRNDVRRAPSGQLDFGRHNALRSLSAPEWLPAVLRSGRLGVELEARSAGPQGGPARLFALSESPFHANLVLGQGGDDLLVRVRRPGSTTAGSPAFHVRGVFAHGDWVALDVELEPDRVRVAVDGEPRLDAALPGDTLDSWSPRARVALGDEPGGGRAWRGSLRRATVRVDGDSDDLLAPATLECPAASWVLPDRLRRSPSFDGRELGPALLHFAGFAPLGFLLAREHGARRAALLCALLSLGLSAAKVFVAGRHPAALDVVTQVAGALCGALAARRRRA